MTRKFWWFGEYSWSVVTVIGVFITVFQFQPFSAVWVAASFEVAVKLSGKGVAMDADKNRQVMTWYPAGVPESELDALAQRLTARASLRVVGG